MMFTASVSCCQLILICFERCDVIDLGLPPLMHSRRHFEPFIACLIMHKLLARYTPEDMFELLHETFLPHGRVSAGSCMCRHLECGKVKSTLPHTFPYLSWIRHHWHQILIPLSLAWNKPSSQTTCSTVQTAVHYKPNRLAVLDLVIDCRA